MKTLVFPKAFGVGDDGDRQLAAVGEDITDLQLLERDVLQILLAVRLVLLIV